MEGERPQSGGEGEDYDVITGTWVVSYIVRKEGQQIRLLLSQLGCVNHRDLMEANFLPVEHLPVVLSPLVVESLRHSRLEVAVETDAGQYGGHHH